MHLLARNEEMNQWLKDNPAVLGSGALLIGGGVFAFGLNALVSGQATDKWGREMEGGMARAYGGVMALVGGGLAIFGLLVLLGIVQP